MNVLTFVNDGPLLLASNYWQSEMAAAGKLYVSINTGCFRLLVPQSQHTAISDMRPKAKHFVVSMLPRDKWVDAEYCLEWMVEDGSDTPWACHLSPGAVDRAPNHEDVGIEWRGSVWDFQKVALTNAWSAQPTTSSSQNCPGYAKSLTECRGWSIREMRPLALAGLFQTSANMSRAGWRWSQQSYPATF